MNFPKEQRRILLIEDDYGNRVLFADFLEQCGYRVLPLADGNNCIEIMQEFLPHLVLLDIKLPHIDGVTLIQAIRNHSQFHAIPILVVSGYAFQADRRRALAAGATDYMVKPILPVTLNSKILSLLKLPPKPISYENTSQENTSQENTSQENTSQENASQERPSQENASQENASQENVSQERGKHERRGHDSEPDSSSGFWR
ncbi:response regulator containing a CheY-like receiver domain and an HD-GYP domain [Leptolyngbya sp. PCC 7375]|nr:response regulator containing a CheY-like receiver domain and an HD-GYP domain [Leptolyngbya sp. PCC 7375]